MLLSSHSKCNGRRVRKRIGQEDKERLVRAYQSPEQDFLAVADNLGRNRSTAGGIIAQSLLANRVDETTISPTVLMNICCC